MLRFLLAVVLAASLQCGPAALGCNSSEEKAPAGGGWATPAPPAASASPAPPAQPPEAKTPITIEYHADWLTTVSLKDGELSYVWHTVKPGKEHSMNPANYDRHEFKKRLSAEELARFSEWIDTCRVFSLPKKFDKADSTGYAVQAGARFFVSRGDSRYEKKLDGRGEIPKEFSDATAALVKLCESIRDGVRTDLAPELRDKRDKLLAQADATIRKGLLELGEKYPQMKKAEKYWESLAGASSPGRIGITYFHSDQGKAATMPKGTVPEKERVSVLVVIKPPPEEMEQLALFPLYPNLGLVGQVGTSAGDPELDAALKKLVDEALKPLVELNAASATERSRPPEAKDAAAAPPPEKARFGIYLVDGPAGLREAERTPLEDLVLGGTPVLTEADIVSYDAKEHVIRLKPGAKERLVKGLPKTLYFGFVVVADAQRCYLGAFSKRISSYLPSVPVCYTDDREPDVPKDALRIEAVPISKPGNEAAPDPRSDRRVAKVLKELGKLKDADAGWGEAIEGVQVRLVADKTQWKSDETPTFKADFRNTGKRDLRLVLAQEHWEIDLDEAWHHPDELWYHPTVMRTGTVPLHPFGPGAEHDDIPFTPMAWGKWQRGDGIKPLEFTPGKHTVRVAFTAHPVDKDAGKPVRVVSGPVEIEIVPAE